jgi:hypothetical protein
MKDDVSFSFPEQKSIAIRLKGKKPGAALVLYGMRHINRVAWEIWEGTYTTPWERHWSYEDFETARRAMRVYAKDDSDEPVGWDHSFTPGDDPHIPHRRFGKIVDGQWVFWDSPQRTYLELEELPKKRRKRQAKGRLGDCNQ